MTRRSAVVVDPAVQELRSLMEQHALSQRDVASLAAVSKKTVEGWLASPGSSSARGMADRNLTLIRAQLPGFLAARRKEH